MKTQQSTFSRRDFLKNASLATGFLILPTGFLRGQNAPSNRINVAIAGFGGQGKTDAKGVASAGANIAAVCEVDSQRLGTMKRAFPQARTFEDYREMLDKMGKDLDGVVVATHDSSHFTITLDAIQRGKHVYVQKPMCHSIDQCRRLVKAAADNKVVSSMGNQGHSSNHIRLAREWYEAGLFGNITTVDAWTGQYMRAPNAYRPPAPVPKQINWDLWLGPVSWREYSPGIVHAWRPYREFGSGPLGDMAAHVMDPAFFIFDLDAPEKIEVLEYREDSPIGYPGTAKLAYHFPAKGKRGPIKMIWWHGKDGFRPTAPEGLVYQGRNEQDELNLDDPKVNLHIKIRDLSARRNDGLTLSGSLFHTDKMSFFMGQYGDFLYTAPHEKFAELKEKSPPVKYKRSKGGHYRDWINAIRTGGKAVSDFAYAGPLTEIIIMGNIALRLKRTLHWDANRNEFTNDAEATALIKSPPPRPGFHA